MDAGVFCGCLKMIEGSEADPFTGEPRFQVDIQFSRPVICLPLFVPGQKTVPDYPAFVRYQE